MARSWARRQSRECRIDSIAQSWAVLSRRRGVSAARPRATQRCARPTKQLVREAERLVLLFWPPFDRTLHDPGYVRAYPPGIRENGGQYTHAATWLGWAYARSGDGEKAERIFRLLNPVLRSAHARASRSATESSLMCLRRTSIAVRRGSGRGGWTWYTGAAAWIWRLGVEAILGLQRESGLLRINPCVPPAWSNFEAWIVLGQRQIHITVDNPDHVAKGLALLTLDGLPISSNVIALDPNVAGTHELHVQLGAASPDRRHALAYGWP